MIEVFFFAFLLFLFFLLQAGFNKKRGFKSIATGVRFNQRCFWGKRKLALALNLSSGGGGVYVQ